MRFRESASGASQSAARLDPIVARSGSRDAVRKRITIYIQFHMEFVAKSNARRTASTRVRGCHRPQVYLCLIRTDFVFAARRRVHPRMRNNSVPASVAVSHAENILRIKYVRASRSKPDERAPSARKFWLSHRATPYQDDTEAQDYLFESRGGCVTAVGIAHTRIWVCFAQRARIGTALLYA
jgi:hypothetical protein